MNAQGRTVASIQVRMGSSRLPGKVMRQLINRPLLGLLIDRLRLCKTLDEIIVATSVGVENDVIESFCNVEGIRCYRGSEDDVLDRTLKALEYASATIGVEVFGDCPLIDPLIVDNLVNYFREDFAYDFVGNDLKTTYPPGMEVEVFAVKALSDSSKRLPLNDPVREHGTLFIRQHPELYNLMNIEATGASLRPELELEVDTAEDFSVISSVVENFRGRIDFTLEEIIRYLDANPQIASLNSRVHRRWKEFRVD